MTAVPPIVTIADLCYSTGGQDILHNINLDVFRGDFISIIGPNGGGKTTLLKLILGLLKPSKGTIRINGRPPGTHGTCIGYVPQHVNHNLRFPATALDVVLMGAHDPRASRWARTSGQTKDTARETLAKLGVADCAGRKIAALSGGQRQRILIARALVSRPEMLVLDEPTASIDTKGQTEFYELLKELNKELTILMVSHDLLIVSSYAKSIACLNRCMHYHQSFGSSREVLDAFYSCSVDEICPVGVIAQQPWTIRKME
ncbi:metal ABC transporter ATP-binding protein [Desulfofustis glycolicus]|uniref:Zinc transport system ATP-binding protein n=1 Tax=Desulfofustis glycolicus DSM 9705 TaxID=1121409 RepID=A0A1M5RZV6_9BACT|nr:metal ABC transporter ATP-binding protein [Desulfofustis glycolicus]MCB2216297.1 metal ABC transporter ATP-binding protein [Desulfobulbaceae bacterium]SHH31725.1 zinc transport system ATP-binding protein [Desulfofustis glycolicus DSM 9705]